MRGDLTVRIAYAAAWTLTVVYRDTNGVPINVTGYTGELRLSRYNGGGEPAGDPHGETILALAATVGTTNGQFTRALTGAQTLALADTFGSPLAKEKGRWSLWITPPAGSAFPVAYGWVDYRPVGEAVSDTTQDVYSNDFAATVSAVGARGETGATGPQGPPGTGTAPTDGRVQTTSTTLTTLQTISLASYLNKFWLIEVTTTGRRESDGKVNVWRQTIQGFTASDGTTTHEDPLNLTPPQAPDLGRPIFENGAASLVHRIKPSGLSGTTKWARDYRVIQTWSP